MAQRRSLGALKYFGISASSAGYGATESCGNRRENISCRKLSMKKYSSKISTFNESVSMSKMWRKCNIGAGVIGNENGGIKHRRAEKLWRPLLASLSGMAAAEMASALIS
jgi:hypothetical protein